MAPIKSNLEKVAVLLMVFGEDLAGDILKHLPPEETRKLLPVMARMSNIDDQTVEKIVAEFSAMLQKPRNIATTIDPLQFTQNTLKKALGSDIAEDFMQSNAWLQKRLDITEHLDASSLGRIMANEHPQTVALVLAFTEPKKVGAIISQMQSSLRQEVILRMIHLKPVSPEALEEIDLYLREEYAKIGGNMTRKVGGIKHVADVLSNLSTSTGESVLQNIEEKDPYVGAKIRDEMFTFNDILRVDPAGIRTLIPTIPQSQWILALKSASAQVKTLIFSNMSERNANLINEEMQAGGPVRRSDVEEAQKLILAKVIELQASGKLAIRDKGDVYV